jgi:hypothetical protein
VNPEEQEGFRQWVSLGLAEHPDRTLATLTRVYSPQRIKEARGWLKLARALEPPDPEPEPGEPGKPACNWCASTTEPLTSGYYKGDRPAPPMEAKPGPHGIPELYEPFRPAVRVQATEGDLHCAGTFAECDKRRQAKLDGRSNSEPVRSLPARQEPAPHQQRAQELVSEHRGYERQLGFKGKGYIGHGVVYQPQRHESLKGYKPPAWLSGPVADAELILTGASVMAQEVGAWVKLTLETETRAGELLALTARDEPATPPLTAPFAPVNWWSHTLANPANRTHLVSGSRTIVAPAALPDSTGTSHPQGWEAADHRRGGQDPRSRKPRRRRHYFI